MSLINYANNLQLKWSEKCILVTGTAANQAPEFKITETKLYVSVVTLSAQDNVKLLKQLEYGFKGTINWNKYHSYKKHFYHLKMKMVEKVTSNIFFQLCK